MKLTREQRDLFKEKILEGLVDFQGNVGASCHRAGIGRRSFYTWKETDKKFKEESEKIIKDQKEELDDYVEGKLINLINENCIPAIIFYLKTRNEKYQLRHLLELNATHQLERNLTPEEKQLIKYSIKNALPYGKFKEITKEDTGRPELSEAIGEK